jgi:hypothetical protein
MTSILRPLVGALSSSTSASTPDPVSSDDYLEIGPNVYGEPMKCGRLINMVVPNGDRSNNTPADIPPSKDQRRPMLKLRVVACVGT